MEDESAADDSARAARAIAAAGDAIVTVGKEGSITSWNEAAETLLGHSADAAVGETLALIIPAEDRGRHIAGFRSAVGSAGLAHHGAPARVRAVAKDGTTVPLVMTLGLLRDPSGRDEVAGVVAVLRRADREPLIFAA